MSDTSIKKSVIEARLDWDSLRVFAAVSELGSMSAAARQLGVTTSSVSKRIDELEYRLRAKLLNRSSTGVLLTPAGHDLRDRVQTMQRTATAIENTVFRADDRLEGRVIVSVPDGLAAGWIAPRLQPFLGAHPGLDLILDCGFWARHPTPDPADIAITVDPNTARGDDIRVELGTLHYMAFAARSYLDAFGKPQSMTDLAQRPTIRHLAFNYQKENWRPRTTAIEQLIEPRLLTNSSHVMLQAIKTGAGIGVMPTYLASMEKDIEPLFEAPFASIRFWMVYASTALENRRLQTTVRWLKDLFQLRQNPWFRDEFIHPREFESIQSKLAGRP